MDILRKYFSGQLSPHEEEQVQDWLLDHADDQEVIHALNAIMAEMESENHQMSAEAFASVCSRLGIETKSRSRILRKVGRWMFRAAVCIVLTLTGAAGYHLLMPEPQVEWAELKVPHGQTGELLLADGTHLHLNAGSRVTYPLQFIGNERRIFVEGEGINFLCYLLPESATDNSPKCGSV